MTGISEARLRTVLAWAVILLTAGPVGAAVVLGMLFGESPCILCWAQRTSMVLMALTGISKAFQNSLNFRYSRWR